MPARLRLPGDSEAQAGAVHEAFINGAELAALALESALVDDVIHAGMPKKKGRRYPV